MKEIFFDGRIFKSMKDFSEFARIPTSTVRRWNFLGLLSSPDQLEKCMKKHRAHGRHKRPNAIKHHDEKLESKRFNIWNEGEIMEINGKVHCFFEQSGTFKNEFKKLGIEAFDYDIQDEFEETDFVIDLFHEIDNAYETKPSIFDKISSDDLIIAFYPCIYFCTLSQLAFYLKNNNYIALNDVQKIEKILERSAKREEFYRRLLKFVSVCLKKHIRMIFENPWQAPSYLKDNFLKNPDIIDTNRMERGDFLKKTTAYWFWNCEPTHGFTYQNDKKQKLIHNEKKSSKAGVCSIERSLISSDYARNWICDFVLGKGQENEYLLF